MAAALADVTIKFYRNDRNGKWAIVATGKTIGTGAITLPLDRTGDLSRTDVHLIVDVIRREVQSWLPWE
uniref:Uncharacterized protein n=1 Tax=uncultured prokaryote TaxID=198431 RepID=A0A0H5Q5V3_9ZZZZ|nr:hypothetical protein [uncultured prokaryote]